MALTSYMPLYAAVDANIPVSLFALCFHRNVIFQPTYGRVLFTSYTCEEW